MPPSMADVARSLRPRVLLTAMLGFIAPLSGLPYAGGGGVLPAEPIIPDTQ